MNAVAAIAAPPEAVALALPDDMAFPEWVDLGRGLFSSQRQTEWMLADWFAHGRRKFADEEQMALFLDELGVDAKRVASDAKVAELIPTSWRSDRVSFDVCKRIAKVEDVASRQQMLKQAVDERWNERDAHHHVVEHKVETGQLFDDGDDVSRLATEIVRCWNRATPDARDYFFALAEAAAGKGFGIIDQDEAT